MDAELLRQLGARSFLPFTAAKAAFALKAGERFLRGTGSSQGSDRDRPEQSVQGKARPDH